MVPARIIAFLNAGESVVADLPTQLLGTRSFVRIRPLPKPDIPREEQRYLNSRWSIWEYWNFEFRRLELRQGWEKDEWNYDRYIVQDDRKITCNQEEFEGLIGQWIPDVDLFKHITESDYPE